MAAKIEIKDEQRAVLEKASNNDKPVGKGGTRKYTDDYITVILSPGFSDDERKKLLRAAERQALTFGFREANAALQNRIDNDIFEDVEYDPEKGEEVPLSAEIARERLRAEIIEESDIEGEVENIAPADHTITPGPPEDEQTTTENTEGSGGALGEDDNYPSQGALTKAATGPTQTTPGFTATFTRREPVIIPKEVLGDGAGSGDGLVLDQISKKIPPLVPIGSLSELTLFMEPISRQVFTLIMAKPTAFFYVGINIPCMYPIIVPPFYPVVNMGPAPVGAIAMAFIDPTIPYCGGSQSVDANVFMSALEIIPFSLQSRVPPRIVRCDYNLPADQLAECVKAQQAKMAALLDGQPAPPELQKLFDLIKELQTVVKTPDPVVIAEPLPPQQEVEVIVNDIEDFDFKLDIIR